MVDGQLVVASLAQRIGTIELDVGAVERASAEDGEDEAQGAKHACNASEQGAGQLQMKSRLRKTAVDAANKTPA